MNTADLKQKAKNVLRYSYWWSLLVSLIMLITSGRVTIGMPVNKDTYAYYADKITHMSFPMLMGIFSVIAIYGIVGILLTIFLRNPVVIGHDYFYIKAAENNVRINNIGRGFQRGYLGVVKTMFLYNLYISLWGLLFIIPGIIKIYEYFMVEYIIAENPLIPTSRAFEISRKTMNGQKFNVFVFQLTFLGWFLLGTLAYYIGIYFVMPYYQASLTQMYLALKDRALSMGYANYSDFDDSSNKIYI